MRITLLSLALLLAPPADALPTQDDLRTMAYAGDVAGLASAFDAAQTAFLAGDMTADEMRALTTTLIVTHPTIRQTIADWLDADPSSAPALAITAFNLEQDAFAIRSNQMPSITWPDALAAFSALHGQGTPLAIAAYESDPRFIPASDVVMAYQGVARMYVTATFHTLVAAVMDQTPSRNGLIKAGYQALPQWGGGGVMELADLCTRHADQVTDVADYDVEVCMIDMLLHHPMGMEVSHTVAEMLRSSDHPLFEWARVAQGAYPQTPEGQAAMLALLEDPTTTDIVIAQYYDEAFAMAQDLPQFTAIVAERSLDANLASLEHDPYNPDIIANITSALDFLQPPRRETEVTLTDVQVMMLARNRVVATPYDPWAWAHLSNALQQYLPPSDNLITMARINEVVFGHHSPDHLWNMLTTLTTMARASTQAGNVVDTGLLCQMVRADRLMTAACQNPDAKAWLCERDQPIEEDISAFLSSAAASGACSWESTADPAEIVFFPTPFDIMAPIP